MNVNDSLRTKQKSLDGYEPAVMPTGYLHRHRSPTAIAAMPALHHPQALSRPSSPSHPFLTASYATCPLARRLPHLPAPHARTRTLILCQAGHRRVIIKRRVIPRAQRQKRRFRDDPRDLALDPASPSFPGRLTSEINGANGPLQLTRLIQDYGLYFSGTQATMALARLASFATFQDLNEEQRAAQARAGRRCVLLLRQRLADCDPLSYARATYALGRLGLYDGELVGALVSEVEERLNLMSADALAALVAGLGALGHRPPEAWLDRFALEVYTRFGRFNGPELASVVYGLARLQYSPSAAWTVRCLECFRAVLALPPVGPIAVAIAKFAFGAALMQVGPSFNWTTNLIARARPHLDSLTPRELAGLVWALARWLPHTSLSAASLSAQGHGAGGTGMGQGQRQGPPPLRPPAAAVGLERPFLDSWYRCMTRRLTTADTPSLVLALQGLAALQVYDLSGKFISAMLARLQTALAAPGPFSDPDMAPSESQRSDRVSSIAGTAAAAGRTGERAALAPGGVPLSFLVSRGPGGAGGGVAAGAPGRLQGEEAVSVLLSLVALRIRPGADWMEACLEGVEPVLPSLSPTTLCDLAWALGRLEYQPSEAWEAAFRARCDAMGPQQLTTQQVGVLAWACGQLRMAPPAVVQRGQANKARSSSLRNGAGADAVGAADLETVRIGAAGADGTARGAVGGAAVAARKDLDAQLQAKVARLLQGSA